MKLKRYSNFINESNEWIYEGDFIVTVDMVRDGRLINEKIPNKVTGDFDCRDKYLISLIGCPEEVGRSFDCGENELTTLEGCPKKIIGNFDCGFNKLTNLEYGPIEVGVSFVCQHNKLTDLEGCPKEINAGFYCDNNELTSLENGPTKVVKDLNALFNKEDLNIETEYIKSNDNKTFYWRGLLRYMISKNINLAEIKTWPQDFIDSLEPEYKNLLSSNKSINKYKL